MSFAPGDTVLVHEVWQNRVWVARPMTVVDDGEYLVALWFPAGTGWKRPIAPPARSGFPTRAAELASCLAFCDWLFEDAEWDLSTLTLMRPGEWHALQVSWLADGTQWGWYVNLQEPFRRTPRGFETMDLVLDVVIDVDRTWHWKDDDELETFVAKGLLDDALAERIRDEGLRVARRAERNESPFDGPWPSWRPDPAWAMPTLPDDWSVLCR